MKSLLLPLLAIASLAGDLQAQEQPPSSVMYTMEIPSGLRAWYRNPDG